MKKLLVLSVLALCSCSTLTPQQQANITLTENLLATAARIAAPLISNKSISNDLYAVSAVSAAYGSQPVPTSILQATTLIPGLAGTVLPLVTGQANGPRTQAIISGAADILATLPNGAPPLPNS
jgi:hypothetical protein